MTSTKRLIVVLFFSTLGISASGQIIGGEKTRGWEPTRTWVVAIGLLEFRHGDSWDSFPKEGRKDAELVEFFRQAGVPRDQILFLKDRAATKAQIMRAVAQHLSRAHEGDLLIFYYTGHGAQDDEGTTYFATYDATDDLAQTALSVPNIFKLIERNFKGASALLLADCCYSGALADEALKRRSNMAYAVLTSARSDSLSTAEWTFTEALLSGFRGNSKIDRNHDGAIELSELARYERSRMWSKEEQVPTFKTSRDFSPEMVLAEVGSGTQARAEMRRVEVEWEGDWYPATILEVRNGRYRIHYVGYGSEWDEWVDSSRLRTMSAARPADQRLSRYESTPGLVMQ